MPCRSSTRPASSPSTTGRATHAGLFDVSHMGPCYLSLDAPSGDAEADHAAVAAIVEPLICGDIAGLKPGRIRYTLLLNRGRRRHRRPDGGAARRSGRRRHALHRRQCRHQGWRLRPDPRSGRRPRHARPAPTTAASSPCRGRRRPRSWPALRAGRHRPRLHDATASSTGRAAASPSRAPAIPARTASRSWSPPTRPSALWDRLTADEQGQADRPRRPRFAAPRSRPAAQRPRPRRDHLAGRGRPRLRRLEAPARGAAISPALERILRELAEGTARRRVGIRPSGKTPAREGTEIRDMRRPPDRHRHLRRLRPHRRRADRHGLCRRRRGRARHAGQSRWCAARRSPRPSSPCPSFPTAITANPHR